VGPAERWVVFARGHAMSFAAEALQAAGTRARAEVNAAKAAKSMVEVATSVLAATITEVPPPLSPPSPIAIYLAADAVASSSQRSDSTSGGTTTEGANPHMPDAMCSQLVSALQGAIERDLLLATQVAAPSNDHEVPSSSPKGAEEFVTQLSARKAAASARTDAARATPVDQFASNCIGDGASTSNSPDSIGISKHALQTTIARLAIRAAQAVTDASRDCSGACDAAVIAEAKLRRCVK